MNRREFLARASLIAAGAVAADQLELLDRLGWVRRFFPAWGASRAPVAITAAQWDALLKEAYTAPLIQLAASIYPVRSPLKVKVFHA